MSREKKMYILIRVVRFLFATSLFVFVSFAIRASAYYIAQRTTNEVSEDIIRIIHIALSVLAYHSFFRLFITSDAAARKAFCNSGMGKFKYILTSFESVVTLILSVLSFIAFPNAFAVKSLLGWLEIPYLLATVIMASIFTVTLASTWIECLFDWTKVFEKEQKEKRARKETWRLIKGIIGICLAYPIMAYVLPVMVPTFRTLPSTILVLCAVVIPIVAVLVIFFTSFDYIRAFLIRKKFIKKLKKAARINGYELSKINHPYASLFHDYDELSFTVKAHGKVYSCKFLAGISYGDPMYFESEGKGTTIRHVSLRYRTLRGAPFSRGGLIWHKLPDDLMQFHTEFKYSFDGEGTKILLICPTPHTIYAVGHGQQRLLDVNDKIWGYTIMTATAFINALERDAVL